VKNLKIGTLHNHPRKGGANLEGKGNLVKRILGQNLDEVNKILLGCRSKYRFKILDEPDRSPGMDFATNK
jgi:hypothetical protein